MDKIREKGEIHLLLQIPFLQMLLPNSPSKTAGLPASHHTESSPCPYKVKQNININVAVLILNLVVNKERIKKATKKMEKLEGTLAEAVLTAPTPTPIFPSL
jgi:hypothetical protein